MQYQDYYRTLGIERGADAETIKRAYRKLARKYHPDVSDRPDAEARFKEVGEAYEVLKDAEKRAAYDQLGSNWRAGEEFTPPPGYESAFEFRSTGTGGRFDFSDFFEGLFGGVPGAGAGFNGARHRHTPRGHDQHAKIEVTLEDAFRGAERSIEIAGARERNKGATTRTLRVKIPRSITKGQRIRLPGQGQRGAADAVNGDLYLEVDFAPHPLFRVQGKDIYLDVPVAPWEAALGATVEVPTLGGKVGLKVPAGSGSGRKLRLKGRGLAGGDQYAVLQMVAPAADSEAKRALFEKMAREMSFEPRAHF